MLQRLERLLVQEQSEQLQMLQQHSGPLEETDHFSQPLLELSTTPLGHSATLPRMMLGGGDVGGGMKEVSMVPPAVRIRMSLDQPRSPAGVQVLLEDGSSRAADIPTDAAPSGSPFGAMGSLEFTGPVERGPTSSSRPEIMAQPSSPHGSGSSFTNGHAPSLSELAMGVGGSSSARISQTWKLPAENVLQGYSADVLAIRIGQFRLVQQGFNSALNLGVEFKSY